jgi:hypothetical protein
MTTGHWCMYTNNSTVPGISQRSTTWHLQNEERNENGLIMHVTWTDLDGKDHGEREDVHTILYANKTWRISFGSNETTNRILVFLQTTTVWGTRKTLLHTLFLSKTWMHASAVQSMHASAVYVMAVCRCSINGQQLASYVQTCIIWNSWANLCSSW